MTAVDATIRKLTTPAVREGAQAVAEWAAKSAKTLNQESKVVGRLADAAHNITRTADHAHMLVQPGNRGGFANSPSDRLRLALEQIGEATSGSRMVSKDPRFAKELASFKEASAGVKALEPEVHSAMAPIAEVDARRVVVQDEVRRFIADLSPSDLSRMNSSPGSIKELFPSLAPLLDEKADLLAKSDAWKLDAQLQARLSDSIAQLRTTSGAVSVKAAGIASDARHNAEALTKIAASVRPLAE
jgi:hypothetical protein